VLACTCTALNRQQELDGELSPQVLLAVVYEGVTIDLGYRMDLLVEDSVVVELKCVEAPNTRSPIAFIFEAQRKEHRSSRQFSRGTPQRRHQATRERQKSGIVIGFP
jgi:hypothetical protein